MNIEARMTDFSADSGADLGVSARQLAAAAEPVFIFDGKQPVLVWANAAALALVGHASVPGSQLPHLDRSMPALARLRVIAAQDVPAHGLRTDLVFWTPRGAQSLACICRRATFAFAPEAMIVHAVTVEAADAKPATATAPVKAEQAGAAGQAGRERSRSKTSKGRALKAKLATKSAAKTAVKSTNKSKASKPTGTTRGKIKSREDLRARRGRADLPVPDVTAAVVEAPPLPSTLAESSHDIALREIARQIQAATQLPAPGAATPPGGQSGGQPPGRSPMLFTGESDAPSAPVPLIEVASAQRQPVAPRQAKQASAPSNLPSQARHNIDFLSHIGHEIRTPLNSIMGFAEIMREERFGAIGNDRYKTYAADIHDSALHALSLINDLLDLSRIEAGGLQLDLVEVDVAQVISQAVASLQPIAAKAGVVLSAPAGRPLPKLVCDARALKQMLLNLLSNAIKHTDFGRRRVGHGGNQR